MNRKLYVGNLPYKTTEDDLSLLFSQVGTVEKTQLMPEAETGRSRGFAFVTMATDEQAQDAIRQLHQSEFDGRRLTVNVAKPRPDGPRLDADAGRDRRRGNGHRREARW